MLHLVGRKEECGAIERLVDGARRSKSSVVMIEAEPGMGKSALLDHTAGVAVGMTVLRAQGIESEFDLSYGALSRLLYPIQHLIESLDPVPSSLLSELIRPSRVFEEQRVVDRFSAGAAVLALLSAAAETEPVTVLVDDVQWIDDSSIEALAFAGRRLDAEGIVLAMSCRTGRRPASLAGVMTITLSGLDPQSVAVLLDRRGVAGLSDERLKWLTSATDGNPLAIEELPSLVDEAALKTDSVLYEPLPIGSRLEQAFGERAEGLGAPARQALLLAAIVGDANSHLLHSALLELGLNAHDLTSAEDMGLLLLKPDGVQFRHPLIRSAVTHRASPLERRRCHLAVAAALARSSNPGDEGRRAWHLAAAAPGLDETAAGLLQRVAERAERIGGFASASHAYERAAQLTLDEVTRAQRYISSAEAAYQAGMTHRCQRLINDAEHERLCQGERFRSTRLQSRLLTAQGHPADAFRRLSSAARETEDPLEAAQLLLDAVVAYAFSGDAASTLDAATRASELAQRRDPVVSTIARLATGAAHALRGDSVKAASLFVGQEALPDLAHSVPDALQYLTSVAFCDLLIEDFDQSQQLLSAVVEATTTSNVTSALPFALNVRASSNYLLGSWAAAVADASQSAMLAHDTGRGIDEAHARMILALVAAGQGRGEECRNDAHQALDTARQGGARAIEIHALIALGLLGLAENTPDKAVAPLEEAGALCEELGLLELSYWSWPLDLVDAYVRCGRSADAHHPQKLLEWHAERSQRPTTIAAAACARGLLADSDSFDLPFEQALEALEQSRRPFEHARTHLYYGERLRRAKKRSAARTQLHHALKLFQQLDAAPWADRASHELTASGATLATTTRPSLRMLTPQELQVALTVAEGSTTKETATQLFLSPKTIEYHLASIYRKLDISSRSELTERLGEQKV